LLQKRGDGRAAEREYCNAIILDDDNHRAHEALGGLYLHERGDLISADYEFMEVLRIRGYCGDEEDEDKENDFALKGLKISRRFLELVHEALSTRDDIPARFLCPISRDVMLYPIVATDGRRYERWHIDQWLQFDSEARSPVDLAPMSAANFTYDDALRMEIRDFIRESAMNDDLGPEDTKLLEDYLRRIPEERPGQYGPEEQPKHGAEKRPRQDGST